MIYLTDQVISWLGAAASQEAEISNFSVEPKKSLAQDTHEKVDFTIKVSRAVEMLEGRFCSP